MLHHESEQTSTRSSIAKICAKYLAMNCKKSTRFFPINEGGKQVEYKASIEGQLRTRKWTDTNGIDRWTTEVRVGVNGTMQMLGGGRNNSTNTSGNNAQSGQQGGWGQPQQPQQTPSAPRNPANEPPMDFDDDIPF